MHIVLNGPSPGPQTNPAGIGSPKNQRDELTCKQLPGDWAASPASKMPCKTIKTTRMNSAAKIFLTTITSIPQAPEGRIDTARSGAQAMCRALAAGVGYITYLLMSIIIPILPCGKILNLRSPLAGTLSLAAPAGSSGACFAKNILLWKSIACRYKGWTKVLKSCLSKRQEWCFKTAWLGNQAKLSFSRCGWLMEPKIPAIWSAISSAMNGSQ